MNSFARFFALLVRFLTIKILFSKTDVKMNTLVVTNMTSGYVNLRKKDGRHYAFRLYFKNQILSILLSVELDVAFR